MRIGRFLRGLIWVPLLAVAVVADAVASSFGHSTGGGFIVGLGIGTLITFVALATPVVASAWGAARRDAHVRALLPGASLWECAADPTSAASLIALGPGSEMTGRRLGATGLTIAIDSDAVCVFEGSSVPREILRLGAAHLFAVHAVSVANGWGFSPAVRIAVAAADGGKDLYLPVRSPTWPGMRSRWACSQVAELITCLAGGAAPSESAGRDASEPGPVKHRTADARGRFRTVVTVTTVFGILYATGIIGRLVAAITASAPPLVVGLAVSPAVVCVIGAILLVARSSFARAFFAEVEAGYTTLRWLVPVVPQLDLASGVVIRQTGQQPLGKEDERVSIEAARKGSPLQ